MSIQQIIEENNENIRRLENTISKQFWNKGYINNCKKYIAAYKAQNEKLKSML
jgi:hypothetical protein